MYEFVGVSEFARTTSRSRQAVLKMIRTGSLQEFGYRVERINPRRGAKIRWAIGIPQVATVVRTFNCHCPRCGKRWLATDQAPQECPACLSTDLELSEAA